MIARTSALAAALLTVSLVGVTSAAVGETPTPRSGKTSLVVGTCAGDSPYATIQQAADAAANDRHGAKILVCPGTYHESVLLTGGTDIVLKPFPGLADTDRPVLEGPADRAFALVTSGIGDYTVRGMSITGSRGGLELNSNQGVRVLDTSIDVDEDGIWAHGRGLVLTAGNDIRSGEVGIEDDYNGVRIEDSTITADVVGVYVQEAGVSIARTVVHGARNAAVALLRVGGGRIEQTRMNRSGIGLSFDSSSNVVVSRSKAKRNGDAGIRIDDDSARNQIEDVVLRGNGIDAVDGTTVREGDGTAGTLNTWESVTCETSDPVGLCS